MITAIRVQLLVCLVAFVTYLFAGFWLSLLFDALFRCVKGRCSLRGLDVVSVLKYATNCQHHMVLVGEIAAKTRLCQRLRPSERLTAVVDGPLRLQQVQVVLLLGCQRFCGSVRKWCCSPPKIEKVEKQWKPRLFVLNRLRCSSQPWIEPWSLQIYLRMGWCIRHKSK